MWQDEPAEESGGKSRVATMVQKLQESLALQQLEQAQNETPASKDPAEAPSSSSPLPNIGAETFVKPQHTSPLQAWKPQIQHREVEQATRPQVKRTQSGGMRYEPSRQIGDPLAPGVAPTYVLQSKAPLPAYKRPSIRPPIQAKVQPVVASPIAKPDEFGDDDFDLTADDLDELCTQIPLEQRSLHQIPAHPNPPPQPQAFITLDDDNDDDEFGGDDIDEDSFAQAEFSATQSMRVSHRPKPPM